MVDARLATAGMVGPQRTPVPESSALVLVPSFQVPLGKQRWVAAARHRLISHEPPHHQVFPFLLSAATHVSSFTLHCATPHRLRWQSLFRSLQTTKVDICPFSTLHALKTTKPFVSVTLAIDTMHLTKLVIAALPALALADTTSAPTTTATVMATSTFTKTITLSHMTNVTSTSTWAGSNSTTSYVLTGTGSMTTMWTAPAQTSEAPVVSSGGGAPPAPTKGPQSAGASVQAPKFALAGVAGLLVAAMF